MKEDNFPPPYFSSPSGKGSERNLVCISNAQDPEASLSSFETLIYEKSDHIAYVTLNRPQALNVYNIQMRDDLYEVLSAIKDDPEVRVAIFKGAGEKAFCAGADLSEFLTARLRQSLPGRCASDGMFGAFF